MTVLRTVWTSWINIFKVRCDCGKAFDHPSNDSIMICPACGTMCYNEHSLWKAYGKPHGIPIAHFDELDSQLQQRF